MDKSFEKQLRDSLYVHFPLSHDESKSMETKYKQKKVVDSVSLWDGKTLDNWRFTGEGTSQVKDGMLVMNSKSRSDHWPGCEVRSVDAENGAYATFGSYEAKLNVAGMALAHTNRLHFEIRPLCNGLHSPIVRPAFINNGVIKIPDAYAREGFNAINLKNFEWNTCLWEIDSIAHDKIEEVSFIMHRYGKELSSGEDLCFEIRNISLEQVEDLSVVHGWQCHDETAVYPTTGYFCEGKKTAVVNTDAKRFSLVDADTESIVFESDIDEIQNRLGSFGVMDFSQIDKQGRYYLQFGDTKTSVFRIDDDIAKSTIWKLLNFIFCERCGFPVPGKHGTCHGDIIARHNGLSMVFHGGWHDAADVSQQAVQSGEIAEALMSMAAGVKDSDDTLYRRLLEEANWGMDFVLGTRFGDGWRATSALIRRWTDNLIGNMDDCPAFVKNNSLINTMMAGIEALGAITFAESDPALAWKCKDAARDDFAWAMEKVDEPLYEENWDWDGEHTDAMSISQYHAAICLTASRLFAITADDSYAKTAVEYANKVVACQEDGAAQLPMKGFFYRDSSKKHIIHSSHQSRDYLCVQALCAACDAIPDSPDKARWEKALALHGEYLKQLMQYNAPYGLIAAGMYQASEADDEETFKHIHPRVNFEEERANYLEQLSNGCALGKDCYVRSMPVWFSFRGNSAILLSMGKAAAIVGRYLNDEELLQIAREQMYWTLGKNPFGQSLIYGEGENFGQQYTALLGETVGEMSVGVQTRANEDLPYWPQGNIATYREVWIAPVSRWLWLASDLLG